MQKMSKNKCVRYKVRDSYGVLGYVYATKYKIARKRAKQKFGVKNIRIKKIKC